MTGTRAEPESEQVWRHMRVAKYTALPHFVLAPLPPPLLFYFSAAPTPPRGRERMGILKQVTRGWSSNNSLGLRVDSRNHLNHLECTSFDLMSVEHSATIAVALIPLLTVQVRVVENEWESSNN